MHLPASPKRSRTINTERKLRSCEVAKMIIFWVHFLFFMKKNKIIHLEKMRLALGTLATIVGEREVGHKSKF